MTGVAHTSGESQPPDSKAQKIRDLTMMLLFLTRCNEPDTKKSPTAEPIAWRSRKDHDRGASDRFEDQDMIDLSQQANSLGLTDQVEFEARRLLRADGLAREDDA